MKRDPITITPAAEHHIGTYLSANPGKMLLIRVNNKGCAGHKYAYELIDADLVGADFDVIERAWGKVAIDKSSILWLLGSTLDLRTDSLGTQLSWNNPLAVGTCGCGDSFSTTRTCDDNATHS